MTAPPVPEPLAAWRRQLDAWAIPEEILAAVPDSPWELPVGLFRSRADQARQRPPTPSDRQAARWLPAGGTVLDGGPGGAPARPALGRRAGPRGAGAEPARAP